MRPPPPPVRVGVTLALLAACGSQAEPGERRVALSHHDPVGGAPPLVRFRGSEVFHDGRWVKDGPAEFYDARGELSHRGQFRLGRETGRWSESYEDGGAGEGEYVEGRRSGVWTYHHPDGSRAEQGTYVDGRRQGVWTAWYPDGAVQSEVTWEAGAQSGPARYWNRDRSLNAALSGTYRDGEKVR